MLLIRQRPRLCEADINTHPGQKSRTQPNVHVDQNTESSQMCLNIPIILISEATIPCAGSASGSRTTAAYLRDVFLDDQLDLSTSNNLNEPGGKVQQPGRGSCERGAHAKKCELEGHIKKRLSWLNTQQVPENNNF